MKKKKIILILLVFLLLVLVVGAVIFVNRHFEAERKRKKEEEEKRKVSEIKKSFSKEIVTKEKKKIYQKKENQYVEVGFVEKNIFLPLEENKIQTSQDIYFKIQGLDYYIDYLNIEKKIHSKDHSFDHFISTKKIITTEQTNLYQENTLALHLPNTFTFDVLLEREGKYYVSFLDDIYYIQDQFTLEEKQISTLTKLSVLSFESDISSEKLEEVLSLLKSKEYSTITFHDFVHWVQGEGNLKENSVLLLGDEKFKTTYLELFNKYSYHLETNTGDYLFHEGDQQINVSDQIHYRYVISNSTSISRVTDMLNGVKKVIERPTQVAVLNYHFFYDASSESCNESICLSTENFKKQLDYLKSNGYKTLTMQEFYDWKTGNLEIPKKSVLLTIDDGAMGTDTHLPAILEEYQMHASLFLITGWWDVSKYQKSSYLEIYSHGEELHHDHYCVGSSCGYKPLMLSKDEIVQDLNLSISKLPNNNKLAFCYPFYRTNKNLENALKEVGISLAFVGGNKKVSRNVSNYYLPRYVVYKGTSLEQFIQMVS